MYNIRYCCSSPEMSLSICLSSKISRSTQFKMVITIFWLGKVLSGICSSQSASIVSPSFSTKVSQISSFYKLTSINLSIFNLSKAGLLCLFESLSCAKATLIFSISSITCKSTCSCLAVSSSSFLLFFFTLVLVGGCWISLGLKLSSAVNLVI